jgi:hypothetical protein
MVLEDAVGVEYDRQLQLAYQQAKTDGVGIHSTTTAPLVQNIKNAVDDYMIAKRVPRTQASKGNNNTDEPGAFTAR